MTFPGFGEQRFGTSRFGFGARDLTVTWSTGRSRRPVVTAQPARTLTVTPREE